MDRQSGVDAGQQAYRALAAPSPAKKEWHPVATAAKAVVKLKTGKEVEVYVVREIKRATFEGFMVCLPDPQVGVVGGRIFGAPWAIPSGSFVRWVE